MQVGGVREFSPRNPKALKEFVILERSLLGGYPLYVSYFDREVARYLSGRSAFTHDAEISLFIASDGSRDVARCAAMVNPRYQEAKHENVGFIGYFAAAPGCERRVRAMLEQAESRLRAWGVRRIIAPYNGNSLLGMGLLTAAFDEEPVVISGWNPPYYVEYLTGAGFQPTYPLLVYTVDTASSKYQTALERARAHGAIKVRPIDKRKWRSEIEIFRQMINENFTSEWEWYPATREEFAEFFGMLKPMIDPHQMLIAEVEGVPAGICIGFPNWNPLVRSFQGKLGVWQQLQFLLRGRRYDNGAPVVAAVVPNARGMGIGTSLEVLVVQRYVELGAKAVSAYFVNAENHNHRRIIKAYGGLERVLYHVYDKSLS
jgi:GNAT superfamily N-acetyltransferase